MDNDLHALQRRLTALAIAAWVIALSALVVFAAWAGHSRALRGLDVELASYAAGTQALAWFDEAGRFRDEFLREEQARFPLAADLWILQRQPARGVVTLYRPPSPVFVVEADDLVGFINATAVEWRTFGDGRDRNARPFRFAGVAVTDDAGTPMAAALLLGDPEAARGDARRAALQVLALGALLVIPGVFVSRSLLRRALVPSFELQRQRRRLIEAAAHELRTPMAALSAVVDSGLAGDEPAETALGRVRALISTTTEGVEELLLFGRLEAGRASVSPEPIRLDLLAEAIAGEFDAVEAVAEQPVIVRGEAALLGVAVRNLVRNALQHGAAPVRLAVEAGVLEVRDGGPGFPAELLREGPRRYASAHGTGLGLPTVAMIANLHDGALHLDNLPGGARARLSLPVSA